MGCNCKEGNIYQIGFGCCRPSIMPADDFYTKPQIDEMLDEIKESGCCITEEEVDEKIASAKTEIEAEIPSLSGYATEQWVLDKHYITGVDLSDYALKSEIPTVPTDVSAFNNDAGYLTEHQSLSAYSTTNEVNSAITQATSGLQPSLTAGRAISISSNTVSLDLPIYQGSNLESVSIGAPNGGAQGLNNINSFCGAGIGWGLVTQNSSESSIGGFNVSRTTIQQVFGSSGKTQFTIGNGNNDGYRHNSFEIRENGDIYIADTSASGEYYEKPMIKLQDHLGGGSGVTSGEVQTMINEATSGLQQTLTAGTNVQINNNIISATDTTYTAGDNISISNQNVISTVTKFWCGSEAQWGQISGGTLDNNTIYMVY